MCEKEQDEDLQEALHYKRIINAFAYYRTHSMMRVVTAEKYFHELPTHHKQMLPHFKDNLRAVRACIEHNYDVIQQIIKSTSHMFLNKDHCVMNENMNFHPASDFDMDKVKTTLRQFVRDWCSEGEDERKSCYTPVIQEILQLFPPDKMNIKDVHVLIPGAGLGRLALEIAKLGYACQGNEFSLFMLFASNFVLNRCKEINSFTIYPWVHHFCNNRNLGDQIHPVTFPDTDPTDLPEGANFSMAAGDFLEVYTEPESWDCVATVFFLDTAHNIISYVETIWHILKPGGYWINFGPLLYHFADMPNESSIEITYAELRDVIRKFHFEVVKEEENKPCSYTQNPRSMLLHQYNCIYFVVRKPLDSQKYAYTNTGSLEEEYNLQKREKL